MRIVDIRERPIRISRYRDPHIPSGGLTTSLVAVVTDVVRTGQPVVGYGFASIGRYAQSGLIRDRFAPRLLRAATQDITTDDGANLDPFRAWTVMMTGEKPGGHGERCVAVGTLDMALWDAAAKIAEMPLHQFLAGRLERDVTTRQVPVYASGGYPYPDNDIAALAEEIRHFADLGFTHVKIKIGAAPLDHDLRRIEAAAAQLTGSEYLAVDAMNTYDPDMSVALFSTHLHPGDVVWLLCQATGSASGVVLRRPMQIISAAWYAFVGTIPGNAVLSWVRYAQPSGFTFAGQVYAGVGTAGADGSVSVVPAYVPAAAALRRQPFLPGTGS
jgi:L-alanine-DL-glutamate epimerase-like enolase superfamily enzyme